MTFGDYLKEFIESKNFPREKYMEKFEMSYYTMHKYFNNKSLPGYKFLYRLKRMGFKISEVFTEEVFENTMNEWSKKNGKSYKFKYSEKDYGNKGYSNVGEKKVLYTKNKK